MASTLTANTLAATTEHAVLSARPRALASWDTSAYAGTGISFHAGSAVPATCTVVEAGVRGMRNAIAVQGASPPRENPR